MLFSLLLGAPAAAQGFGQLIPSGQPALEGITPGCRNLRPIAVARVWGNPFFQLHAAVALPAVPAGSPLFLMLGVEGAPRPALGAPPLNAAYGLPGILGMPVVVSMPPAGVAWGANPPVSVPIPPGLGAAGLVLTAQIAVFTPGGVGLTRAIGIFL